MKLLKSAKSKLAMIPFERGSLRKHSGRKYILFILIGLTMSVYQIWSLLLARIEPVNQMSIHFSFILVLTFFLYTFSTNIKPRKVYRLMDGMLMFIAASCGVYYYIHAERIATRIVGVDPLTNWDVLFGLAFVLLCIEAARRTIGLAIIVVALFFIVYALFGHLLTGIWYHNEISFIEMLDHLAFSYNGLWGSPISVAASFVFVFILFGAFLQKSGAGEFFFNLSAAIAGRTRGGAAKIAILASALFGSISGSPTANVVTTGPFTIPMAKKTGYSPKMAAAIEACASTGGSLLPPIMGSSAFLMAAVTGISYKTIAVAAILPGVLFYLSLFSVVHFEALRLDLPRMKVEEIPSVKKVLKEGWYHFIPVTVLVVFLLQGYSPSRTGVYGILAIIVISWFTKSTKLNLRKIIEAMADGAKSAIPISTACGAAGLVVAGIMTTGLGGKLNSIILNMTAGKLFPSLILIMIMCIVLGMGMPVAAAYVLTAMLAAPALIGLGVSPLAAHLFIVYFSIISAITPPVAVAAFAAAGIAGASPTKVGLEAVRIGLASFVIPFIFVYNPTLLLEGSMIEIIYTIFTASFGVILLGCGLVGYFYKQVNGLLRGILILIGLSIIFPVFLINVLGFISIGLLFFYQYKKFSKKEATLSVT